MRFTLKQINCFVVASKHEYFSDAAHELRMSPSAFSDQISNLESLLGQQLFTRTNRGSRITPKGSDLLRTAKELISVANKLEERLNNGKEVVRLATMISVPEISSLLRVLTDAFPDAEITTERLPYLKAIPSLETKQVDGLFIALPGFKTSSLTHYVELQKQKLIAAVPAHHPLAKQPSTNLEELSREELLAVTDLEHDVWSQNIFGPGKVDRLRRRPMIIEELQAQDLVAAGFGINICPESFQYTAPREEIRYLTIEDAPPLSVGLLTLVEDQKTIIKELRRYAGSVAESRSGNVENS